MDYGEVTRLKYIVPKRINLLLHVLNGCPLKFSDMLNNMLRYIVYVGFFLT